MPDQPTQALDHSDGPQLLAVSPLAGVLGAPPALILWSQVGIQSSLLSTHLHYGPCSQHGW